MNHLCEIEGPSLTRCKQDTEHALTRISHEHFALFTNK